MRARLVGALLLLSCAKEPAPVQDPLDYLRVGVDPREEATAMIEQLGRNGFQMNHRIDEAGYVAFDAARGGETLVRVVTQRGVALSLQAPDVRWPERLWVELADQPRLDGNADGKRDVLVSLRERDRVCLGWAHVDADGFVVEAVRPRVEWGDRPCIREILPGAARLVLELDVPATSVPNARVQVPVRSDAGGWTIDTSSAVTARWDQEVARRTELLEAFELRGDETTAKRVRAELAWLDQLRNGPAPMLEPADDGEKAR